MVSSAIEYRSYNLTNAHGLTSTIEHVINALIKGTTSDVGGRISATINMNTVNASRLVITKEILSPDSVLTMKDNSESTAKNNDMHIILIKLSFVIQNNCSYL